MEEKKLSITQLAEKVNEELKGSVSSDARYSSELSERRIRDYMSKGILDKPFGQGKGKWFGQQHVDKLKALRQLQSDGISDQSLKKMSSTIYAQNSVGSATSIAPVDGISGSIADSDLQKDALGFLSNIGATASVVESNTAFSVRANNFVAASPASKAISSYYTSTEDTAKIQALNAVQKQVSKTWSEYHLDDEGKVFLRVEGSTRVKNGEEILKQVKSILNIGDKND